MSLWRESDRRGPWVAMPHLGADCCNGGSDMLDLAGPIIVSIQLATGAPAINDIRIIRIGENGATFAGADRMPITKSDLAIVAATNNSRRAAVLLRTINPVRK